MQPSKNLDTRSLFVVGDDAQSIYGFRGSKIEIILGFEEFYPNTKEIILNQNYRSNQSILTLAEQVLTHNPKQKKKDLFTDKTDKTKVKYYLARNERDEAEFILRQIHDLYSKNISSKKTEEVEKGEDEDLIQEFTLDKLIQITKN
jgi:DNA helicase II / ATP-dependent DNA helicase PcrA